MENFNILIVDDHPIIISAYEKAIEIIDNENNDLKTNIFKAFTFKEALQMINNNGPFHLFILDIKMPPDKELKIYSGEDLGVLIKEELSPDSKIIISTTYNDNYRIRNILKSIDPDGFLIKNDITPDELLQAINQVIKDKTYYSETVTNHLRKHLSHEFYIDNLDRQLLYEISEGTKTRDLPNVLPLSIAGIERRKRNLKELFEIDDNDDKSLIKIAKEKGFL